MSQTNENSEREKKETAFFLNIKEMPDDVIESKIVYLESIYNSENTRQHKIETKLAATVGYCSVLSGIIGIIGIVGVKDIFHSTDMWINVLTLVLFCLPILFCGISIVLSMYTLRPQVYRRLEPGLILDDGDMGNNAHRKKYLESMYKSIMLNYETNHTKAKCSIFAIQLFSAGLLIAVLAVAFVLIVFVLYPQNSPEVIHKIRIMH